MTRWILAGCVATLVSVTPCAAQTRTPVRRPAPIRPEPTVSVRGFVTAEARTFAAADSFDAVLGSHTGPLFGAGVDAVVARHLFVSVGVSRFQKDGERVYVYNDEVFPLGLDTTVKIVPIELSAGWRFSKPRQRIIPYAGGGITWLRYEESSEFAASGDDVKMTKTGFQVLGGVEWRATRWVGVAGEAEWMRVPNGFADLPTSAAAAFGETDLGGAAVRLKVVLGR